MLSLGEKNTKGGEGVGREGEREGGGASERAYELTFFLSLPSRSVFP